MHIRGIWFLTLCLGWALTSCDNGAPKRIDLQITTRGGGNFLVAGVEVSYVAVCYPGSYSPYDNVDDRGLRFSVKPQKPDDPDYGDVLWKDIDSVSFGAPAGNRGGACDGLPTRVAAVVHYKDGHNESRDLEDTTDFGIEGQTDHGKIIVPLREVAKLGLVPDQDWPWAREPNVNYNEKLHLTHQDGKTQLFGYPEINTNQGKGLDGQILVSPFGSNAEGLPTLIAGAREDIAWHLIKSVDFEPLGPDKTLKGTVTFTDGHKEERVVRDLMMEDGQETASFYGLKRLEVEVHPTPVPKTSS